MPFGRGIQLKSYFHILNCSDNSEEILGLQGKSNSKIVCVCVCVCVCVDITIKVASSCKLLILLYMCS